MVTSQSSQISLVYRLCLKIGYPITPFHLLIIIFPTSNGYLREAYHIFRPSTPHPRGLDSLRQSLPVRVGVLPKSRDRGPELRELSWDPTLRKGDPKHQMGLELIYLGGSTNGGTPSSHPFLDGIFHEINHPAIGVSPFMETPIYNNHN